MEGADVGLVLEERSGPVRCQMMEGIAVQDASVEATGARRWKLVAERSAVRVCVAWTAWSLWTWWMN